MVRRIFHDTVAGGCSTREIARRLAADQIPTPAGRQTIWVTSTISRLLRNEAYIGRLYFNRTESVPAPGPRKGHRQIARPAEEWVLIPVPPIIDERTFTAASKTMMDNFELESTASRTRPMAAQRPCQVRLVRGRDQRPPHARPQRHLAPLLLLPQPRPDPRRRRRPALPGTQHPRRRAGQLRVRPGLERADPTHDPAGRRVPRPTPAQRPAGSVKPRPFAFHSWSARSPSRRPPQGCWRGRVGRSSW